MSVFAAAENVLADVAPTLFGKAPTGTFIPFAGSASTVRVITGGQREANLVFNTRVKVGPSGNRAFRIPREDLAVQPRKGDRLLYEARTYVLKEDADLDTEETEWMLNVDGGV